MYRLWLYYGKKNPTYEDIRGAKTKLIDNVVLLGGDAARRQAIDEFFERCVGDKTAPGSKEFISPMVSNATCRETISYFIAQLVDLSPSRQPHKEYISIFIEWLENVADKNPKDNLPELLSYAVNRLDKAGYEGILFEVDGKQLPLRNSEKYQNVSSILFHSFDNFTIATSSFLSYLCKYRNILSIKNSNSGKISLYNTLESGGLTRESTNLAISLFSLIPKKMLEESEIVPNLACSGVTSFMQAVITYINRSSMSENRKKLKEFIIKSVLRFPSSAYKTSAVFTSLIGNKRKQEEW